MRVIWFDIDSMRPDHFGCYGYHRDITPNMDRIARQGVRFNRCYVNSSPCVPSRASFMSGRFGIHHGALTHWGPGSEFRFPGIDKYDTFAPLLPRYLRENGYRTVSFSSFADRHLANWFYAGWEEFNTSTLKRGDETADEVNAAVLPWLERNGASENYFLHIQYWDPHRNYEPPQAYFDALRDQPAPDWPDAGAIREHAANYGPFAATELYPARDGTPPNELMPARIDTVEDFKQFVDGYDASIRYMDDRIGEVFSVLDRLGVLDDVAIVISADHGESMGEQGIYGDHVSASEPVHNVPLIIRWPGVTPPDRSHDGLLYNVDVHPTLCELLGLPVPQGWDGESFTDALRGEPWAGRPYLVWDHCLYTCQRAVRTPEWLYIRNYHPGLFPWDDVMLYDMRVDRRMTRNLIKDKPEVARDLDGVLNDWLQQNLGPGSMPDPMGEVIRTGPFKYVRLEPWLARLRAKGRTGDADRIVARLHDGHGCQ
ncbi:sulfatase family protein [Devosia nitrariae]|uniref:Sulfatase n=1 Tax=Devosia nitrariae TaxID=2071872 RepID=A0ABQ5W746_9HYPH|nr:sulfatase [Devosia nitrariae]GLQ55910.1 sulfatase [Devosia nitrariae]